MTTSPIDIVIFAPLASIFGVILFWFIQLLFIESQKYILSKIKKKHEPLCRFTNFLGIFFQSICHALGYTVTRSGISNFYISVEYGQVSPKKEKKGIFEWVSNSFLFVGPFFIPASLILICLFLLARNSFNILPNFSGLIIEKYTFSSQLIIFGSNLYSFSEGFFGFLFTMDLFHPGHLGFLILLIFLGMGIRPSYIGEKKIERVDMMYDLKNIKNHIRNQPLYIFALFMIAYIFFYISIFFQQDWYVGFFSILGWISIISIISLLIAHLLLILIREVDKLSGAKKYLPYLMLPCSYCIMRLLFFIFPSELSNSISLFVMIFSTFILVILLKQVSKKDTTNKFKTGIDMKSLKKLTEGENGGSRRIIRK